MTYFDITRSRSNSFAAEVLTDFFLCCRFFFFFFPPSPPSCVSELCESIRATFRLGRLSSVCVCVWGGGVCVWGGGVCVWGVGGVCVCGVVCVCVGWGWGVIREPMYMNNYSQYMFTN